MDKITVAELATECSVKNQVVLAELKRLGLYVFSPTATIDASFAETIRKKILSQREAEEAKALGAEKKKEAEAAKKKRRRKNRPKKLRLRRPNRSLRQKLPAPKKAKKALKVEKPVEVKPEEAAPKASLAPRKGRKHYDRESAELVEQVTPKPAVEAQPAEAASERSRPRLAEAAEAAVPAVAATPEQAPAEPEAAAEETHAPGRTGNASCRTCARTAQVVEHAPEAAAHAEAEHRGRFTCVRATRQNLRLIPGVVSKKIVIPKAKTKILMRTSTERVVTPEITDRILKGLREEKPAAQRAFAPYKVCKKEKA